MDDFDAADLEVDMSYDDTLMDSADGAGYTRAMG